MKGINEGLSAIQLYQNRRLIATVFYFLTHMAMGQRTMEGPYFEDRLKYVLAHYPARFEVKTIAKHGFLYNQYLKTAGIKVGVNFHREFSLGIGVYYFYNAYKKFYFHNTAQQIQYTYLSCYIDYSFINTSYWIVSVLPEISVGRVRYHQLYEGRYEIQYPVIYEPSMSFQRIVFRYFTLGAGVGYRLILLNFGKNYFSNISPYYLLKTGVLLERIGKDIKRHE